MYRSFAFGEGDGGWDRIELQDDEECDATEDDSSNKAGSIKIKNLFEEKF